MRYILEFFVSSLAWFWIFVYLYNNPTIILEHGAIAGSILFAIGFGRWLLLVATEDPQRLRVMMFSLLGMVSGIAAAAVLFVPELSAMR